MPAYRIETVVTREGAVIIKDIPLQPGEKVEVIILTRPQKARGKKLYPLRGKPIHYIAPFDSVAENDWEILQ
ncbi:MAG: hypothetical protein D6681_06420 [Calditrichaeota bacterium]|nr:MAG: hypothetical protein D6681_06420 [Calditrichota bacterium]